MGKTGKVHYEYTIIVHRGMQHPACNKVQVRVGAPETGNIVNYLRISD
jgi:hypothetical protein